MRNYFTLLLFFVFGLSQAQELNCTVSFNTDQVAATNQQVFKTLQKSLTEFLNNTKWTDKTFKGPEKINCSFFFNVLSYNNVDQFTAILQVQASRPIFNSTYNSPILNINDKDFSFTYTEFQNLNFNPNSYDSNLLSTLAFYANMIIAVDADSFSLEGGTKALENAMNIVSNAQQTQDKAWTSNGNQNRYYLVNDMISPTYSSFRKAIYEYHFGALDKMAENQKEGKEGIRKALKTLREVAKVRPNAYLTRVFFDAKANEILDIFTDGPKVDITEVVDNLNRLSPTNSSKWSQISY
ncbi:MULTISPECIES: DUF4835 family protein [Flavobacterium]|uniref:DUF4835 family protein n=1 Tax=Flavobacterium hankyongi TaxID=1176532 RepID=A0ABP8ZX04_9FLAO|nr:DUF4835 family protein [Flavobacterium sp. N1846]